jgi:arsenate reductase
MTQGVLFLCTGNACRSQMAEGIARALFDSAVLAFSAGTKPKGVDARAVRVMHEIGLDISSHRSKATDDVPLAAVSLIVTLCGDAAEQCPALRHVRHEHWPLPDPATATGSDNAILAAFRAVRDDLVERIGALGAAVARQGAHGLGAGGLHEVTRFAEEPT